MKKVLFLMLLAIFAVSAASAAPYQAPAKTASARIAVIPYLDTSEQDKDYVPTILDENYTNYFSTFEGLEVVPFVETQKAIGETGYDPSNMVIPDKDIMATVAEKTNADYVVAMELVQVDATRHLSFFQAKISVIAKLRYNFYNTKKTSMTPFQVTGSSDNKTVFGGVGFKDPIAKSLVEAMGKANEKIKGLL